MATYNFGSVYIYIYALKDFWVTVKVATLILISRLDWVISSTQEGKSGSIYLVNS